MAKVLDRARANLWRVPVGWQLSALYTVLMGLTLALLGWALYSQLDRFLIQNKVDRLQQSFWSVMKQSPPVNPRTTGYATPDSSTPAYYVVRAPYQDRFLPMMIRDLSAPDVTVAILDTDGTVMASTPGFSDEEEPRALPALPDKWRDKVASGSNGNVAQWLVPGANGGRMLLLMQPFILRGAGISGEVDLFLLQAASLGDVDAVLSQLRLYVILGILIGTVIGVVAGLALTNAVLKPLDRMVVTAEAIAGGDLNRRLRMPSGRNEVARLGGAFDNMVDRLAASLQAQRRFIADASHELRTPLTSLEGLSEMLMLGADRGDSGAVQRVLRSMHGELRRMSRLVGDLLTLSRLDSASPIKFVDVDLSKLIDDVAMQVAPLADTRHVNVAVSHNGPIMVQADPDRLKQVVLNLVDNALRFTPAAGQVQLSTELDRATNAARIRVIDNGPGIAAEDLPHIFDRFYRGDASRTRATGNSGLGLAIARGIVQAHGGAIEAESVPGEGAHFTVTLQAEPTAATTQA